MDTLFSLLSLLYTTPCDGLMDFAGGQTQGIKSYSDAVDFSQHTLVPLHMCKSLQYCTIESK